MTIGQQKDQLLPLPEAKIPITNYSATSQSNHQKEKIIIIVGGKKMKGTTDLGGDDQNPTSQERDVPMVEGLDDVDDADGIRRPVPERIPGLREDGDEHMLLHVEGPRVETELPAGDTELAGGEDAG